MRIRFKKVDILVNDLCIFEKHCKIAESRGLVVTYCKGEITIRNSIGALLGAWHARHTAEPSGWINYIYTEEEDDATNIQ